MEDISAARILAFGNVQLTLKMRWSAAFHMAMECYLFSRAGFMTFIVAATNQLNFVWKQRL